jgi:lambda family phage portal protein
MAKLGAGLRRTIKTAFHRGVSRGLATLQGMFDAGGTAISRIRSWVPSTDEINNSVVSDGVAMRNRSRKLIVNNGWAAAALDIFVANAVGTGPIPRPKHPDKDRRKQMIALFDRWSPVCTSDGSLDFYGCCAAAVRAQRSDGDSFTRLRYRRPEDGLPVSLQLQLLEADFCPLDKEEVFNGTGNRIQYGIEVDGIGRNVAYHMYASHPAGRDLGAGSLETHRIPAEEIVHVFEVRRPGQKRGYPWLTPSIIALYDIKQLLDASLLRQKISNLLSVWISRSPGNTGLTGEKKDELAGDGRYETTFGPGTVNYTSGESVQFLNPPDSGQNFRDFFNLLLRSVARSLGLTLEQLTGDYTGFSFASSRAAILEFRRLMEQWQYMIMIHQFCRPIWNAWIKQALIEGKLWPEARQEWIENPDWFEAEWAPAAWPWVDPVKDLQASKDKVRSGFGSRQQECARMGVDSEVIDAQNADDNERADGLGLVYDSDGRVALGQGLTPSTDEPDEPGGNPQQKEK